MITKGLSTVKVYLQSYQVEFAVTQIFVNNRKTFGFDLNMRGMG